jgi:hypothetical protein
MLKRTKRFLVTAMTMVVVAGTAFGGSNSKVEAAHKHSWKVASTTSATCTKAGSKTYKCSCGKTKSETINALGHSYKTTTTKATCTATGKKVTACSRCGSVKSTTAIKALGHCYAATTTKATCTTAGKKVTACARCGNVKSTVKIAALGHDWVGHEATAKEKKKTGYSSIYVCTRCKKSRGDYANY